MPATTRRLCLMCLVATVSAGGCRPEPLGDAREGACADVVKVATALQPVAVPIPAQAFGQTTTCKLLVEPLVTHEEDDFEPRILVAPGWLTAFVALYGKHDPKASVPPTTEDAARVELCLRRGVDRCEGPSPWTLSRYLNSAYGELEDRVYSEPDGKLLVYHAGMVERTTDATMLNRMACVPQMELAVSRRGSYLHVARKRTSYREQKPTEPTISTHEQLCGPAATAYEDDFYDTTARAPLFRVKPPAAGERIVRSPAAPVIAIDANVLLYTVAGCSERLTLRSVAP